MPFLWFPKVVLSRKCFVPEFLTVNSLEIKLIFWTQKLWWNSGRCLTHENNPAQIIGLKFCVLFNIPCRCLLSRFNMTYSPDLSLSYWDNVIYIPISLCNLLSLVLSLNTFQTTHEKTLSSCRVKPIGRCWYGRFAGLLQFTRHKIKFCFLYSHENKITNSFISINATVHCIYI